MSGFSKLGENLDARKRAGLYRQRRLIASAQGRELLVDGHKLLNFCSNDYLGLANDARVRQAFADAANEWGAGSGASHLVSGHTSAHHQLEAALADFTGRPRALLFSSGYAANMGAISALLGQGDYVFEDRLNHASLIDGGRISGARFTRYAHRDIDDLEKKLDKAGDSDNRKLLISDGTFSMDGTTCDLGATSKVARQYGAWLMLDEAHSLGVIGEQGRGLVDPSDYGTDDVQILVGTLGKAFGTHGGFVTGSEELIETLIQEARTYIYTTAPPPAIAVATLTSLKISMEEQWRRDKLRELIELFRSGASKMGLGLMDSGTPIQPLVVGDAQEAVRISNALEEEGLLITAIRPPTVPKKTARLRITFMAEHTIDDVNRLLGALERIIK